MSHPSVPSLAGNRASARREPLDSGACPREMHRHKWLTFSDQLNAHAPKRQYSLQDHRKD
eukprot:9326974-Pyramimonas_sp.AAC.1